MYTILSRLNLSRTTQAHQCKYCKTKPTKVRLEETNKNIADFDDEVERESFMAEEKKFEARLSRYDDQVTKKAHQRKFVQDLRDLSKPNQIMIWIDFVSWHTDTNN